jgi:TFIIH basal transcription factor complex TTD-A subunit
VFLPSDSAVKQILLTLDERPGQSFIIEDLDEFHVLVRADEEQRVKRELEAEVCSPLHPAEPFFFPDGDARSWRRIRIAWKLRWGPQIVVIGARW